MSQIQVKDANNATVSVELPLPPGRAIASSSRPIAWSVEDSSAIGAVTETAPASDTASSGLNGRLQRIAQRLSTLITLLPASLGSKTSANSLPVVIASDQAALSVTNTPVLAAYAINPAPSTYRIPSAAASTNAANIKASAGCVKGVQGYNNKSTAVYIRFYDLTTSPTVGTSTLRKTLQVPGNAAFAFDFGTGIGFANGISIALTAAGGDTDTTALASGDITTLNVDYH